MLNIRFHRHQLFSNGHRENKTTPCLPHQCLFSHRVVNPSKLAVFIPLKHVFTFSMFHSKTLF